MNAMQEQYLSTTSAFALRREIFIDVVRFTLSVRNETNYSICVSRLYIFNCL